MPPPHTESIATPRAKVLAIVSSAFLVSIAVGSAWLGMVFFMRELYQVSAGAVGLLAAVNSLTYVAGCFLLRPVFRRVRSRDCLLIATGGSAAAVLGILLVRSVAVTFLLYALFGFLMAFFWPPLAGWLSHGLESRALGKATSRFNLSWSLGNIVSSYVAGLLSELGPANPIWLSAALFGATFALLVALAVLSPSMRRDDHREAARARGSGPDRSTPLRYPAWVGLFGAWTVLGLLLSVFPLYALEVLGIAKRGIGILLFFRALFTAVAFLLLGRLTFWHFRRSVMVAGQLLFALLAAGLAITRSATGMGLLLCGIGLCGAVAYSSSIFHGMAGSAERARRMGIHEAVLSVGLILGSTAGGFVYEHLSMAAAFLGCSLLLAASAGVQAALAAASSRRGPGVAP